VTYRFRLESPLDREISRIALAELDRALDILSKDGDCIHRRIHDARRCFKRLRALCRLVEPADRSFFKQARSQFTAIARSLAMMRDAQAQLECCQKMEPWILEVDVATAFDALERTLVARRDQAIRTDLPGEMDTIINTCREQKLAFEKWNLPSQAKPATWILKRAWRKSIARAVSAQANCCDGHGGNAFHDLRKVSQTHLMQLTLLADLWPSMFAMRMQHVRELVAILGEEHDIFILLEQLHSQPDLVANPGLITSALAERQTCLRTSALGMSALLFDLDPRQESRRLASLCHLAGIS
jgi:CHAD domain-containing protein